ncbi:Nnf1 [Penicillium capsulatum]|nr:Nnf1 [Penicillium capsulatum]
MAESNSHPPQQPPAAASLPHPRPSLKFPAHAHRAYTRSSDRLLRVLCAQTQSVWRQLNAKLEECANAEFEEIVAEREAVKHLNELDRLVNEARARKEGNEDKDGGREPGNAPHTLGAEELYQAHLTPYLQEAQSTLNNKLAATHAQNTELAQTVQAQRLEIEKLLAHVESVIADVEGAATAAAQFSKDNNIRQDAIQMDEEANSRQSV